MYVAAETRPPNPELELTGGVNNSVQVAKRSIAHAASATRPVTTDGLIGICVITNDYSECTTLSFRRRADLRSGNTTRETHSARPAVDTVQIESLRDNAPSKACP